ncbi:hypothetical protein J2T57_002784 [Natronocella acetinitrilica]|uniref:Uncharacterized protein n=1 Tax=Natronocella acetinitrilica TaxID=414046 RepID=A0AAE3KCC4_9GAMM|nr:hypothetical protein [Natronocella acetinitrilica]MCP1675634.1 hypothetical protein [Natronocella acetinitrilica]
MSRKKHLERLTKQALAGIGESSDDICKHEGPVTYLGVQAQKLLQGKAKSDDAEPPNKDGVDVETFSVSGRRIFTKRYEYGRPSLYFDGEVDPEIVDECIEVLRRHLDARLR